MTAQPISPNLRWFDHIFININWFALTLRTQVLAGLIIPLLVQEFVGEAQKGAYFGTMRLWALMMAVLMQAFFGLISDRSRFKWGRRRPFIFLGTVLEVITITSIAWIAGLSGMGGYTVLFMVYLITMVLSNMSQAGTQGLIPDLVPQAKRGVSSGVKMLLEIPLPLVLVGLVIAPMIAGDNLLGGLVVTGLVMLICMGLTMFAREQRPQTDPGPLDWKPYISLLSMTAVFVVIILGLGQAVKLAIAALPDASRLTFGIIGVLAMSIAVVGGIFASLAVHLDSAVRKNTPFIWLVISRLAGLVAINNLAVFLLYFFQEKFNMPTSEAVELAGLLPMVLGGFVIIFSLLAGWLSDRYDRKLLTAVSGVIGALGVVVMIVGPNIAAMYVAAAIIGLSYALFNVASWALGADIIPQQRAGEFFGLQNLAGAGAGAIGAYIGGVIADQSGYMLMMAMFGVMFLLAAVAAFFIRVKQPKA